jgi:hypothetical protein
VKPLSLAVLAQPLVVGVVSAQEPARPEPLSDNSFLIEEAYNQERGVVQHAFLFVREQRTGSWALSFTEEWPAWSSRHQLSYTVALVHPATPSLQAAFGDVLVHYRYQLANGRTAVAPRLSLVLPVGSASHDATEGGVGVQLALPVSLRVSSRFSLHLNAGAGAVPSANRLTSFVGASLVTFLTPRVNLLLEGLALAGSHEDSGSHWSGGALGTAGVRWGHDFASGMQIVPGLGWSFGTGRERDSGGPVAYLSVEYPFR